MNEFSKARLKLTGWYILISFLLLVTFNIFAISAEKRAFSRIQEVISDRTQRPRLTALLEERINKFESNFIETLLIFDAITLILASLASFFLSGLTLKPIEEMVKAQQEFAADASHELRTPLAIIGMEIEALKRSEKSLPKKYSAVFLSIKEETRRMKGLVEGLLSLVRPEENKTSYKKFSLTEVVSETFNQLKPLAKEKNLEYVILASKARPGSSKNNDSGQVPTNVGIPIYIGARMTVLGNKDKIKQVILILLDNAIKYTPKNGKVEVSLFSTHNTSLLTVTDSGSGIPEKDLPHIFDRFYKASSQKRGVGLGLAIAKKIVDEHGGEISVESNENKGSKFTVQLPFG